MKKFVCFLRSKRIVDLDVDRSLGRRDHAIFLISLRIGLRASDISKLKLADINWAEKTVRVIQKKTKTALELRYKTDSPYVFVRFRRTPSDTPIDPTAFNGYLREYMEAAGMERTGWDGKSFHALSRIAGTKMVTSGVPVSTVVRILARKEKGGLSFQDPSHTLKKICLKIRARCWSLTLAPRFVYSLPLTY